MKINIIVAMSENNGIGLNGKMPWNIKEDLLHFSKTTQKDGNNAIVMGRKTWESIGCKPLKNRVNIVLSNTLSKETANSSNNVYFFNNDLEIIEFCINKCFHETWIIGGEQIYNLFLNNFYISHCIITRIPGNYDCDTFFPKLNNKWQLILKEPLKNKEDVVVERWDQNIDDNIDYSNDIRYDYCIECCDTIDSWNSNMYIFSKKNCDDKILCLDCCEDQKHELSDMGWICDDFNDNY